MSLSYSHATATLLLRIAVDSDNPLVSAARNADGIFERDPLVQETVIKALSSTYPGLGTRSRRAASLSAWPKNSGKSTQLNQTCPSLPVHRPFCQRYSCTQGQVQKKYERSEKNAAPPRPVLYRNHRNQPCDQIF